jgi:hypothetical protein
VLASVRGYARAGVIPNARLNAVVLDTGCSAPGAEPGATRPRAFVHDRGYLSLTGRRSGTARDGLTGRVEHVASGTAGHFDTAEELLAFFGRVLAEQDRALSPP